MQNYTPEELIDLIHRSTNQYMIGEGYFKLTVSDLAKLVDAAIEEKTAKVSPVMLK